MIAPFLFSNTLILFPSEYSQLIRLNGNTKLALLLCIGDNLYFLVENQFWAYI